MGMSYPEHKHRKTCRLGDGLLHMTWRKPGRPRLTPSVANQTIELVLAWCRELLEHEHMVLGHNQEFCLRLEVQLSAGCGT
jgi:hypothetical protein